MSFFYPAFDNVSECQLESITSFLVNPLQYRNDVWFHDFIHVECFRFLLLFKMIAAPRPAARTKLQQAATTSGTQLIRGQVTRG